MPSGPLLAVAGAAAFVVASAILIAVWARRHTARREAAIGALADGALRR